jgi:hypothetical protein
MRMIEPLLSVVVGLLILTGWAFRTARPGESLQCQLPRAGWLQAAPRHIGRVVPDLPAIGRAGGGHSRT